MVKKRETNSSKRPKKKTLPKQKLKATKVEHVNQKADKLAKELSPFHITSYIKNRNKKRLIIGASVVGGLAGLALLQRLYAKKLKTRFDNAMGISDKVIITPISGRM